MTFLRPKRRFAAVLCVTDRQFTRGGFSIRKRPDGGFYYVMNGFPLLDVQEQPGKVTARELSETSIMNGGSEGNLKRHYLTYSIESKDGKLSIETTEHSILISRGTTDEVIIRAQLEPTTENMAGWADLVPDADMPAWIEEAKKKAAK